MHQFQKSIGRGIVNSYSKTDVIDFLTAVFNAVNNDASINATFIDCEYALNKFMSFIVDGSEIRLIYSNLDGDEFETQINVSRSTKYYLTHSLNLIEKTCDFDVRPLKFSGLDIDGEPFSIMLHKKTYK